jgi:hypothetical protein
MKRDHPAQPGGMAVTTANATKSPQRSLYSLSCNVTPPGRKLWTLPPHQAQI